MNTVRAFPVFALVALLAGCETGMRTAPPITAATLAVAAKHHVPPASLEAGRQLYMRRCTECHRMMPMEDYGDAKMKRIVDDMARRAKLIDADKESLLDYLRMTRETP